VLVCTGAGMGVDSGLGTFRGKNAGVWPPLLRRGMDFSEASDPCWFDDDPQFAWSFWKMRHDDYTHAAPHKGYELLRQWSQPKPHGMFSFTSNIDGHWEVVLGAESARVWEVHGTVRHLQCTDCDGRLARGQAEGFPKWGSWPTGDALDGLEEDPETDKLAGSLENLPRCRKCAKLARPNVLMFGDWAYETSRCDAQEASYKKWQASVLSCGDGSSGRKVAVIEIGAGHAVPTVRMEAQHAADRFNAPLIRINLEEPEVSEHQSQPGVSIALGALDALERIDAAMQQLGSPIEA
jgi:NAD-dependent SIR2 family protein deacetylase